jgi:UDP-N-acetyl-D-galactosamine dehydrogenase
MDLYSEIVRGKVSLSLIGLGFVCMPIAVAFATKVKVIVYDLSSVKIGL